MFILVVLKMSSLMVNSLGEVVWQTVLGQLSEKVGYFKSLRNPKRTGWEFLKVITTLYYNRSILIYQNSVYISSE